MGSARWQRPSRSCSPLERGPKNIEEQRESAPPADDSLHARWARYRAAFRDITSWTVLVGLFRFGVGMRAQIDVTACVLRGYGGRDVGPGEARGLELAAVRRSTWMQAEWIRSDVDAPAAGDPTVLGAYLEIGKFLTGEHRSYDQANGTFERVEPNGVYKGGNPFRRIDHRGALEIVGRYSTVDLTDGAVAGGKMRDASLGLNWYLNDSSRVSLNYVHSHLYGVGRSDLILLRFQYNP